MTVAPRTGILRHPRPTVVITGASGALGRLLGSNLGDAYQLRLIDRKDPAATLGSHGECHAVDITDFDAVLAAFDGADMVVHLAARSVEAPWEEIMHANILGAYNVFEAARLTSVSRVVFASSHHVVGFHRRERMIGVDAPLRPDSRYGVSKICGEALGRLYADKYGLSVICQRIGAARPRPHNERALAVWQSDADYIRLTRCCLEATDIHFLIVYGVSRNSQRIWDTSTAAQIGYEPQDDAEPFRDEILMRTGPESDHERQFHGGHFCTIEFDGDPARID
jgi:uronate dehydrogenase